MNSYMLLLRELTERREKILFRVAWAPARVQRKRKAHANRGADCETRTLVAFWPAEVARRAHDLKHRFSFGRAHVRVRGEARVALVLRNHLVLKYMAHEPSRQALALRPERELPEL